MEGTLESASAQHWELEEQLRASRREIARLREALEDHERRWAALDNPHSTDAVRTFPQAVRPAPVRRYSVAAAVEVGSVSRSANIPSFEDEGPSQRGGGRQSSGTRRRMSDGPSLGRLSIDSVHSPSAVDMSPLSRERVAAENRLRELRSSIQRSGQDIRAKRNSITSLSNKTRGS